MLDRMKLGLKLIVAFALLVIVAAGIGGMSIRSMNNMANEENIIYNVNLKSIESIANMMAALRAVGVGERGLLVTKMFSDPEVRKAQFDYVDARMEDLEENWKVFEPIERTAEEEKVWSSFASTFESWKNGHETFMNYMKEKERLIDSGVSEQDARVASIDDKAYEAYMIARGDWLEADNLLMEIEHINDAGALEADEAFKAMAASARTMMLIIIAVGVLLAIALGLYFISNVNGIIRTLMGEAGKLAEAAVNGQLATRGDPEKVNFEFRGIVTGVNDTLDAVIGPLNVAAEYVDRISNGDIPPKITDEYKGDFNEIKNNLNKCIDAVNLLVADASVLSQAAVEGKLATRADASKHQGDFRKIVAGVNDTLDAVIGPLNVAAEYIDRISNGDIPARITDNYNGDFNEIKNNLNKCIDALSGLINDMNHMSKEHDAGDIDVVMDAAKFEGAYKEMASGVNNMVNGHIAVKKKAMACVAEFGKGNFEAPLERFPGKKAFINENIEEVRSRLKALIADANMLSVAAVEGKLATRADASKHQGDFRKIVQGVNDTLDAVIGPLNVAAEYVDRISNGDIPARITDNYNGDFNEIKNNLNKCIDALSGLINDMNHMSKEHDAGDIDVVMDAAKFEGAYKEMASGVNNMVNGHIAVKKKAMACVAEFGKGNFEAPLERFPGKKAFINENIEEVRARLKALIADAVMLAQAAVDGALSTRADVSKHQGDFRKIVQGVNDTLDAVIMPVNEAAEILNYVAQNDLTKLVKGDYKGDHAKIKESLNTAITNLNNVLAQVIDAVTQVGSAAQQISSSAQGVAEGTSEQASSLEEVSSSLEEMS
ncbi:MAG TPA: MCP four helix bundle domain-containing protein, partial [bacterium]|nr:MCP four helix bundle domain-containing protein [bacterium]